MIKGELHNLMLDEFNERNLLTASEEDLSAAVHEFVDRMLATKTCRSTTRSEGAWPTT